MTFIDSAMRSGSLRYWRGVAEFAAPFATLGSFVLSIYGAVQDANRHREIMAALARIEQKIDLLRRDIMEKIDETNFRMLSGEAFGSIEIMQEFQIIKVESLLSELITQSAITKNKIANFIGDFDLSVDRHFAYYSLHESLIALRVAAFSFFDLDQEELANLAKDEFAELQTFEEVGKALADEIGANHVSLVRKLNPTAIDDDGVILHWDYGYNYVDELSTYSSREPAKAGRRKSVIKARQIVWAPHQNYLKRATELADR